MKKQSLVILFCLVAFITPSRSSAEASATRTAPLIDCQVFTGSWNCGGEVYLDIYAVKRPDGVCVLKQTQSFSFEAIADGVIHAVPSEVAANETYQASFEQKSLFFAVTSPQQTSNLIVNWQSAHMIELQITESAQTSVMSCSRK